MGDLNRNSRFFQFGVLVCALFLVATCNSNSSKNETAAFPSGNYVIPETGTAMVSLKAGSFVKGDLYWITDIPASSSTTTIRQVTLSSDYWMGQYEVTQREYQRIMGENPSESKDDDFPVTNVSWKDTLRFCQRLTEIEKQNNRVPEGYIYRLPTDAEWEYACRAGTKTRYFFGDNPDGLGDFDWTSENSEKRELMKVGLKKPNPWGLYDMFGNVSEFCLDAFGGDNNGQKSLVDPVWLPADGECFITRGGGCVSYASSISAGDIGGTGMNFSESPYEGFRIVLAKIPKDWDKIEALLSMDASPRS